MHHVGDGRPFHHNDMETKSTWTQPEMAKAPPPKRAAAIIDIIVFVYQNVHEDTNDYHGSNYANTRY